MKTVQKFAVWAVLSVSILLAAGCASAPVKDEKITNPAMVEGATYSAVWQASVDILDRYFVIESRSETDGSIESEYKDAYPPLWVPWAADAHNCEYFFEETFNQVRRKLVATVKPAGQNRVEIKIGVWRERREYVNPPTSFNLQYNLYDTSVTNLKPLPYDKPTFLEWTYLGPDVDMEQFLLGKILSRLSAK